MSLINSAYLLPRAYESLHQIETFLSSFFISSRKRTEGLQAAEIQLFKEIRESLTEEYKGKELVLNDCLQSFYIPGSSSHALIYIQGNGCFLETSFYTPINLRDALHQSSPSLMPHIMLFNLRGVGQSTGIANPSTIKEDLYAIFKYLVEMCEIDPSNIVIYGHSLGGYLGSFGACYIQEIYTKSTIHFVSDRSFGHIITRLPAASSLKTWFYKIFVQALLPKSSWNQDSLAALESLKGKVIVIYDRKDQVIPYETSAAIALRKKSFSKAEFIDLTKDEEDFYDAHNSFPKDQQLEVLLEKLQTLWLS